jgi:hypothetical protein
MPRFERHEEPGMKLKREAESLPVEEGSAEIDRERVRVAKRRLEELRSGGVKPIPGNEVFAKVRDFREEERFIDHVMMGLFARRLPRLLQNFYLFDFPSKKCNNFNWIFEVTRV